MFLPGTIALPWAVLNHPAWVAGNNGTLSPILAQLIHARISSVPLYMNGNYKVNLLLQYMLIWDNIRNLA